MRVLHVIPSVAPIRGGPSQAVLEMTHAQRQLGIEAEIVTTNDNGPETLPVPLRQLVTYPTGQGPVPIRFFPRYSAISSDYGFSWSLTRWLWQHLPGYDLLHVHALFSYPSTIAMAIARVTRTPYIIRPIGQLCRWSLSQSRRRKQTYWQLIEGANLNRARAIQFTSASEHEEAAPLNLKPEPIVVPHGVHLPTFQPRAKLALRQRLDIPLDEPILLFLSRLHPKKGIDRLIEALGQLRDRRFQLVIAGSGTPDYEFEIEQRLFKSGLADRTHRLGFVEGTDKDRLLQGADLFVLPSHSENFGIAVLEALGAGLPVVTSPGVALSHLVQRHQLGWVVDNTPTALAAQLTAAFDQYPQLAAMGQRGRDVVRSHFSWPVLAQQLIHHYQNCLIPQQPMWSPVS